MLSSPRQAVESVNLLAEIDGFKCMDAIEYQRFCLDKFDIYLGFLRILLSGKSGGF